MNNTSPSPLKNGVVAVLQDEGGRYLLIRRGLRLPRAPGFWCFVGGEVEPGETYPAAIVREASEEVGLRIEPQEKIHETESPNGDFRLHWLRVKLQGSEQVMTLHPEEVAEARWVSVHEALKLDPLLPALMLWLSERANETTNLNRVGESA